MRGARLFVASLFIVALVFGLPPAAAAEIKLNLMVCRDAQVIRYGANDSRVNPIGRGRQFSASLPYLVLYLQLEDVDQNFSLTWELLDPTNEVYARYRYRSEVVGAYAWTYHLMQILPVSSTEKEIVERNPEFRGRVVEVGATPISRKTGQWTLQVKVIPGLSTLYRFTLVP